MKTILHNLKSFLIAIILAGILTPKAYSNDSKNNKKVVDDPNQTVPLNVRNKASLTDNITESPFYDAIVLDQLQHQKRYYLKKNILPDGSWDGETYYIIDL